MSNEEKYLARVETLVGSLRRRLTVKEMQEVEHLIEHGEPGEGLRTLAWILTGRDTDVSHELVLAIRELSAGLVEDRHMPPGFRSPPL